MNLVKLVQEIVVDESGQSTATAAQAATAVGLGSALLGIGYVYVSDQNKTEVGQDQLTITRATGQMSVPSNVITADSSVGTSHSADTQSNGANLTNDSSIGS